jgi:transposase
MGRFTEHHAYLLQQMLKHVDELNAHIVELDARIAEQARPFEPQVTLLETIPGVGRRTAAVVVAEIGVNMDQFPTAHHLFSWAGLCPGNNESASKHRSDRSGKTRKGDRWLRQALTEAAPAAARTRDTTSAASTVAWRRGAGPRRQRSP